ncbi:SAM-dependent methyltransferase [Actinosynnema sp. CS-041913]|uniref:SAM-dependent methyltransferase n=1 Tax=Actinosynnema sp. CS-041913 TaxID=3239917 RepID=UPI003D8A7F53
MSTDDHAATADFARPNAARIHDWFLGGTLHTPRDRAAGVAVLDRVPDLRALARHNRAFLRHAVHHMLDRGIRHFLDLGAGLPTMGAVHQLARARQVDATVVYVDNDAATTTSTTLLLEDTPTAQAVEADLRRPEVLLDRPELQEVLAQPLGLLAVDILDTLPDHDRPEAVLRHYIDALAPTSVIALTHVLRWPVPEPGPGTDPMPLWAVKHPRDRHTLASWLHGLPPQSRIPTTLDDHATPDPTSRSPGPSGYEVAQLLIATT